MIRFGLFPTRLGVDVLHGWQLHPGDVLSILHNQSLTVQGGAAAISGGDAASQDTL